MIVMDDFVYWRHPTLPGIKVEEISGGEDYKGPAWLDMARQIYFENGRDSYRELGHFQNGAPFIYNSGVRISVSHCPGLLVVATLPETPEVMLGEYSPCAALGVDAERADRRQVLDVRERVLSDAEIAAIPSDDIERNVLAWTVKEAAYKAAMQQGVDFRNDIIISRMPKLGPSTTHFDPAEFGPVTGEEILAACQGAVTVKYQGGEERELLLYSYLSDDFIVTLAYSPETLRFSKK